MSKNLIALVLLTAGCLLSACGEPAANNAANKPANAANNAAPAPANAAAIETEVKKLANDGIAAILKADTAALDKLWADNYMFVGPDGVVSTKAQRLDALKSGDSKIESLSYDEMNVRSNPEGTGAIIIGRVTVKGTNMGRKVDGQHRFSQVWSKTKDGWRQVSGQVTPITGAAAPASNTAVSNTAATSPPASNTANANK